MAVTLGPAALRAAPSGAPLRALRAASRSTALPAMQHREDPVRRLLAAFFFSGRHACGAWVMRRSFVDRSCQS